MQQMRRQSSRGRHDRVRVQVGVGRGGIRSKLTTLSFAADTHLLSRAMPLTKSQTLPPVLPTAARQDSGDDTLSPLADKEPHARLPPIHTTTLPPAVTALSTPTSKSYLPPRPSPLARASTLFQSHLPPNLQNINIPNLNMPNLHFELPPALANFDPLAFLNRFVHIAPGAPTGIHTTDSLSRRTQLWYAYARGRRSAHRSRDHCRGV
jgi:hypothetical protein